MREENDQEENIEKWVWEEGRKNGNSFSRQSGEVLEELKAKAMEMEMGG